MSTRDESPFRIVRGRGSEEPDLSEDEIALAESLFDQDPGSFLAHQWALEDAATEEVLSARARANARASRIHAPRTTRARKTTTTPK
jgi:hypothetical protein